jgi:hypothetical protein
MKIVSKVFCIQGYHPAAEEKEKYYTHNTACSSRKESLNKIQSHTERQSRSKQEFYTAYSKYYQYFKKS